MSILVYSYSKNKECYDAQLSQALGIKAHSSKASLPKPTPKPLTLSPEKIWKKINKEFRKTMHLFVDLPHALQASTPFDAKTRACIAGYVGSDCKSLHSVYSIAPGLINPKIPLRDSLQLTKPSLTCSMQSIKQLKIPESGQSGTVEFVHFKNDMFPQRWFAIKQPTTKMKAIFGEQTSLRAFKDYNNTLNLAVKIGNHPNFMRVHGIVFKEKTDKQTEPYLILSYIDGIRLKDVDNLSLEEKIHLLTQLKSALTHLFELGISPEDANAGNFLITKNNTLKLIDFDAWKQESPLSEKLALHLYDIAYRVANRLKPPTSFNPPLFALIDSDIKRSLEQQIEDNIIGSFRLKVEDSQNHSAIDPHMFDEWLDSPKEKHDSTNN